MKEDTLVLHYIGELSAAAPGKGHFAVNKGEQRIVPAQTHIRARMYLCAALPRNNGSRFYLRTAGRLYAKVLGV
jgi:hypothetical protein